MRKFCSWVAERPGRVKRLWVGGSVVVAVALVIGGLGVGRVSADHPAAAVPVVRSLPLCEVEFRYPTTATRVGVGTGVAVPQPGCVAVSVFGDVAALGPRWRTLYFRDGAIAGTYWVPIGSLWVHAWWRPQLPAETSSWGSQLEYIFANAKFVQVERNQVAMKVSAGTACRSVRTPPGLGGHPSVGGS